MAHPLILEAEYERGGIVHTLKVLPDSPLYGMFKDTGLKELHCVRESGAVHIYRRQNAEIPEQ